MTKTMKKVVIGELTLGGLLIISLSLAGLFFPTSKDDAKRFTKVVQKRMAAVVQIEVPKKKGTVQGGGVIISPKGHILTAAHLFDDETATPIVTGVRGQVYEADIIQAHADDDIALIKINAFTPKYAPLARLGSIRIGHEVLAIGHPFGLEWSVTHGIISRMQKQGVYVQFTQTDTAINPGNSGGPVFNLSGQVVGIASHLYMDNPFSGQIGLNMAVSIDAIHRFLEQFRGL